MSRPILVRYGTSDADHVDACLAQNVYRLPAGFAASDVIVDVGAHVGGFSRACIERGAAAVLAYEPDPGSAALAAANLQAAVLDGVAELKPSAVWRSDRSEPTVPFQPGPDADPASASTLFANDVLRVPAIALDAVIEHVLAYRNRDGVRLLKLSTGGSELPILLTSQRLSAVLEVCGCLRTIGSPEDDLRMPGPGRVGNDPVYDRDALVKYLEPRGFRVSFQPQRFREPGGQAVKTGFYRFWARRPWLPEVPG